MKQGHQEDLAQQPGKGKKGRQGGGAPALAPLLGGVHEGPHDLSRSLRVS